MPLPLFDRPSPDLQRQLVNALRLGTWRKREELARSLGVSVRAIRKTASESQGQIVSSNLGLKLTVCCTQAEIDEAVARFRSQISEMTSRILATLHAFEVRTDERRAS